MVRHEWALAPLLLLLLLLAGAAVPEGAEEETSRVIPLVEGVMYPTEKGYVMSSSVTLVLDQGFAIVVDSPSASDHMTKDIMLKELERIGIKPSQVHIAVTTHGHPDHFGQHNLFVNARHLFGPYDYVGSTFNRNELFNQNEMALTKNVELWNTPGHTNQDVRSVECSSSGDLFYSELDALSGEEWSRDAWNAKLGEENRAKVVCACDVIVPGHSRVFRVTNEMRVKAGCGPAGVSVQPSVAIQPAEPDSTTGLEPSIISLSRETPPRKSEPDAESVQPVMPMVKYPRVELQTSRLEPQTNVHNDPSVHGGKQFNPQAPQYHQLLSLAPPVPPEEDEMSMRPPPHLVNYLTAAQPGAPVPIPQAT